jgi:hypothetical protein
MATFSAAAFEHCFAMHEVGFDWIDPVEELAFVTFIDMIEFEPLRTEVSRCLLDGTGDADKPWYTAAYWNG